MSISGKPRRSRDSLLVVEMNAPSSVRARNPSSTSARSTASHARAIQLPHVRRLRQRQSQTRAFRGTRCESVRTGVRRVHDRAYSRGRRIPAVVLPDGLRRNSRFRFNPNLSGHDCRSRPRGIGCMPAPLDPFRCSGQQCRLSLWRIALTSVSTRVCGAAASRYARSSTDVPVAITNAICSSRIRLRRGDGVVRHRAAIAERRARPLNARPTRAGVERLG